MSSDNYSETAIEVSSGNVFADLDNADELFTRACLGVQVMKIIRERGYSQKEALFIVQLLHCLNKFKEASILVLSFISAGA